LHPQVPHAQQWQSVQLQLAQVQQPQALAAGAAAEAVGDVAAWIVLDKDMGGAPVMRPIAAIRTLELAPMARSTGHCRGIARCLCRAQSAAPDIRGAINHGQVYSAA
jgi:hypothetical protein